MTVNTSVVGKFARKLIVHCFSRFTKQRCADPDPQFLRTLTDADLVP